MSAPDTNIPTQTKRHIGPLMGITLSVLCVAMMLVAFMSYIAGSDEVSEGLANLVGGEAGQAVAVDD